MKCRNSAFKLGIRSVFHQRNPLGRLFFASVNKFVLNRLRKWKLLIQVTIRLEMEETEAYEVPQLRVRTGYES